MWAYLTSLWQRLLKAVPTTADTCLSGWEACNAIKQLKCYCFVSHLRQRGMTAAGLTLQTTPSGQVAVGAINSQLKYWCFSELCIAGCCHGKVCRRSCGDCHAGVLAQVALGGVDKVLQVDVCEVAPSRVDRRCWRDRRRGDDVHLSLTVEVET